MIRMQGMRRVGPPISDDVSSCGSGFVGSIVRESLSVLLHQEIRSKRDEDALAFGPPLIWVANSQLRTQV